MHGGPHNIVIRTLEVPRHQELRIITKPSAGVTLRLLSGSTQATAPVNTAEIFGAEMVSDENVVIQPDEHVAVFTWGGCSVQVEGIVQHEYVEENPAMKEYITIAAALDARRRLALYAGLTKSMGPRVLITGAASSGKSSLCQILINYGVRKGWHPCFVELDPRCASDKPTQRFLPGVVGASIVSTTEREESRDPLGFYYGQYFPQGDVFLYKEICKSLAATLARRLSPNSGDSEQKSLEGDFSQSTLAASGIIMNAPIIKDESDDSFKLLIDLIDIFKVDIVLVVDRPSMEHKLAQHFGSYAGDSQAQPQSEGQEDQLPKGVTVLGVDKGKGVVATTDDRVRRLRDYAWRNYFQGRVTIRKTSNEATFVQLTSHDSLEGLGPQRVHIIRLDEKELVYLVNVVLGVSSSSNPDDITTANVAQVANVTQVALIQSVIENPRAAEGSYRYIIEMAVLSEDVFQLSSNHLILIVPNRQLKWTSDLGTRPSEHV